MTLSINTTRTMKRTPKKSLPKPQVSFGGKNTFGSTEPNAGCPQAYKESWDPASKHAIYLNCERIERLLQYRVRFDKKHL